MVWCSPSCCHFSVGKDWQEKLFWSLLKWCVTLVQCSEVSPTAPEVVSPAEMELFPFSLLLPPQLAVGKDRTVFAFAQNSNYTLNYLRLAF